MRTSLTFLSCLIILIGISSCTNNKIESQWKGPDRNGIYPETGLLQEWPEGGPELLWRFDSLQMGHSSPAVTDNAIYIAGMPDSITGYIFCLDLEGNLQWKDEYGDEYKAYYTGSRSTPTIVGDHLYFLSGAGEVFCYHLKKREKVWSKSYPVDFDSKPHKYGYAESPIVDGSRLYCSPGGPEHSVVCLDRFTGEIIWSCTGNGDGTSYSSPILIDFSKRKLLVTVAEFSVFGIDAGSGELLWTVPFEPVFINHVNTPFYDNGIIYMACWSDGEKGGWLVLQLEDEGASANILWDKKGHTNLMSGFIVKDSCIFTPTYRKKEWHCLDAGTGEIKYTWTDYDYGTITYADNRFYILVNRGEVLLCEGSPTEFKTVSSFDLGIEIFYPFAPLWVPPVIKNKRLYIRHKGSLFAYDIADKT